MRKADAVPESASDKARAARLGEKPKPETRSCYKCGMELIFDELNGWFCPNGLCDVWYSVEKPNPADVEVVSI